MSALRQHAGEYLVLRRALGFKLERPGQLLMQFVEWAERADATTVTIETALAWATEPVDADPAWWAARLGVVRTFARHLKAIDPGTEVPPPGLVLARSRRADPYPYSDAEVAAVMAASATIPSPLRAATYRTLIGLLAVTGMRVGEAISLDRGDLNWAEALVVVRHAKFDKSREVVVHPSTIDALRAYAEIRDRHCPRPVSPAFFVSVTGTRLIYKNVHLTFQRLVAQAGIGPRSSRCRPRIHDLRHRFAVATLLGWYRAGVDVEARLPELSTYLGHAAPTSTYWYLHAAPELLTAAAHRLETSTGEPS